MRYEGGPSEGRTRENIDTLTLGMLYGMMWRGLIYKHLFRREGGVLLLSRHTGRRSTPKDSLPYRQTSLASEDFRLERERSLDPRGLMFQYREGSPTLEDSRLDRGGNPTPGELLSQYRKRSLTPRDSHPDTEGVSLTPEDTEEVRSLRRPRVSDLDESWRTKHTHTHARAGA